MNRRASEKENACTSTRGNNDDGGSCSNNSCISGNSGSRSGSNSGSTTAAGVAAAGVAVAAAGVAVAAAGVAAAVAAAAQQLQLRIPSLFYFIILHLASTSGSSCLGMSPHYTLKLALGKFFVYRFINIVKLKLFISNIPWVNMTLWVS
jgi:hypothetical protein